MTTVKRRSNRKYIGAPWARGSGSQKSTKMERTKSSKAATEESAKRLFALPLVVKPDGRWGYKFGKMRKAPKRGRL